MTFPNNHRNSHTIINHGWKYSFLLSDLKNCITYRPQKKNSIIRSCVLRAGSGASWCMRWPPWWSRGGTTCRSAAARAAAGTAASPRPRCWGCPCWSARWSPPSPSRPCCWLEARAGGGWDVWFNLVEMWAVQVSAGDCGLLSPGLLFILRRCDVLIGPRHLQKDGRQRYYRASV